MIAVSFTTRMRTFSNLGIWDMSTSETASIILKFLISFNYLRFIMSLKVDIYFIIRYLKYLHVVILIF